MSWNGIRETLQWMLFLLLIGVVAAGYGAAHFWSMKDDLIRTTVDGVLSRMFPTCEVSFKTAELASDSGVVISELMLQSKVTGARLVSIPRVNIQIDSTALQESHSIVVRSVDLESPVLEVLRTADGVWSWTGFTTSSPEQTYSPEIRVRNGQIRLGIEQISGGVIHEIDGRVVEANLVPTAWKAFDITGALAVESLGTLQLAGNLDLRTLRWNLHGDLGDVRVDGPLIEKAALLIPDVGRRLAELQSQSPVMRDRMKSEGRDSQFALVGETVEQASRRALFRADLNLHFEVGQLSAEHPLDYELTSDFRNGQISELLLPVPLYDVSGRFELTPDKIVIRRFEGRNNSASLSVDGFASRLGNDWSKDFSIKAQNLQIDERLETVLPESMAGLYHLIHPRGVFDLDFDARIQPGENWTFKLRKFTARDCQVKHEYFQYPVDQIQGEVTHDQGHFHFNLRGMAGDRPVTLRGTKSDATGPGGSEFIIQAERIPIDDRLLNSLQMKNQQGAREAIESMQMEGVLDVTAKFVQAATPGAKFMMQLNAEVKQSTANYKGFPYQLEDFSGTIEYDAVETPVWRFDNLKARHGHAHLSGRGLLDLTLSPPVFALEFNCVRVPIDADLEKASRVSAPHLEQLWKDIDLKGTVDVDRVRVGWRLGDTPEITLQGIQWRDGAFKPADLPYRWENVVGALEYDGNRLRIHSLNGWHGETYLHVDGSKPESPAFVDVPENSAVAWHIHMGDLHLMKLNVDAELLKALPSELAISLASLDLRGPVDLHVQADLKGWTSLPDVVTADWELFASLENNDIYAGIPMTGVTGRAKVQRGVWDGRHLYMEGYLELESVTALGMTFNDVTSPMIITDERAIVGRAVPNQKQLVHAESNPYRESSLKGNIYRGQVGLDSEVVFAARPELIQYRGEVSIKDVELADWAADQFQTAQRLKGMVNGWMEFRGMGPSMTATKGKGWVNISPAAIYELPAFAQVFSLLNFRPVGNTAFDYAYAEFDINNGKYDFSYIELNGDALGLTGRGSVGYAAGTASLVNLQFASKLNNQVPILRNIIQPLGNKWIRVQVNGTVAKPVATTQPGIGPLDDLIRQFGNAIDPSRMRRP
ncbi:hypothetical protein KOR42_39830 [Thalassoglobus neptunius]|uniref:Uncharacterized protein n=1 Tax=Thalassoglobus neptunius TaxID=1938619 RepID=A0A5C5WDP4_9PLAN|nr:hypothetical protein [Thalassoglobus neptunius]TWT49066.1 hypothetical protein KOR42_39830 [Thalassoglobus neptunius]